MNDLRTSLNSRELQILLAVAIVFAIIVGISLWHSDPYADGVAAMNEGKWSEATQIFSQIPLGANNYVSAQKGLQLVRAHGLLVSGSYTEALSFTSDIQAPSALSGFLSTLRDSCQRCIDRDSITHILPRLKDAIVYGTDANEFQKLLLMAGSKENYINYIGAHCPNGQLLLHHYLALKGIDITQSDEYRSLQRKRTDFTTDIDALKDKLSTIKSDGIRWRSFIIDKMFDTRYDDDSQENKGVYSGISVSEYSEIVVIAPDRDIPTSVTGRMNVTLLVKPLGRKGYIKGNGYGYKTSAYVPTYETVSKEMDPNAITRELGKDTKELTSVNTALKALEKKTEMEQSSLIAAAREELKASKWE